jgi:hypothetical protein
MGSAETGQLSTESPENLRLMRKIDEMFPRDCEDGHVAGMSLGRCFRMHNTERRHQGLGKRTPKDVHFSIN